jgi:limonene-1,2-epoxide hydrolase
MEPNPANEQLVRRFCEAFSRRDVDELLTFFTDDAVYHNMPMAPATGKDAIRATLEAFVPGSPTIEFVLLAIASAGDVVFTERVDKMTFGGNDVELPVAGVFEIEGERIRAWRDYFDMQQFLNPAAAAG